MESKLLTQLDERNEMKKLQQELEDKIKKLETQLEEMQKETEAEETVKRKPLARTGTVGETQQTKN